MRSKPSSILSLGILVSVAAVATFFCVTPLRSQAAGSALAYDEVTRFVRADQPAPQPGNFAADFQAAIDAQKNVASSTQHHGLFGAIQNAANAAKSAMSIFQNGMASTHYYLNGWERTDDPGQQTATIDRPDRHQIIYLNLAAKTYRIVDTSAGPPPSTPEPYAPPQPQGPRPSPQPGTGKLDISMTSSSLGPKNINGIETMGYNQDFKLSETQSTGSCHDGSFETAMVEYVSSYPEPHPSATKSTSAPKFAMPPPSAMGVPQGCRPSMTIHHSGGATAPGDRLSVWTLVTLKGNAQTNQGQMGGGFSTLIERGNVRTLGHADAGLFDVPAGFTKEQ